MKKLICLLLLAIATLTFNFASPAFADADLAHGKQLFAANCAACHAGGKNLVNPEKTLEKAALEKNGMNSLKAITTQVTNGKGAMPSFGAKLNAQDIEDVASYVLATSEAGW
jgi:cytochrome c6